jgi:hypothetical protein
MSRLLRTAGLALVLTVPHVLRAQHDAPILPVRTFHLAYLPPDQAAKLVSPYVQGANSGVFSAGAGIHAITVRATNGVLQTVDSVLKANDRAPATVVLRFRLIAAEDSVEHDAAIADVDAALRGLFRFRGYRLLAEGATTVAAHTQGFTITLHAASEPPGLAQFTVNGMVGEVTGQGADRSVELQVDLSGPGSPEQAHAGGPTHLSTGLTLPLGQTVVLGSAAAAGRAGTVILAVRAELAPEKH